MKRCFKCKRKKPIESFYSHPATADKHLNKCKACTKKDVRRHYYSPEGRKNIIAYEAARARSPERRKKRIEYAKGMRRRNPGKYRTRQRTTQAVKSGKLVKKPCWCGSEKVQAHHTDYRRPLLVQWLCRKHHMEAEGKQPF